MSNYKKAPNMPVPSISDYDAFMYTYKVSIRRAMSVFIDHPHYHEHIAVWYNSSGEYNMYFNGETVHCRAGTLLFMPPFAVHAMDTRNVDLSETEIISISLPRDALLNRKIPVYPLTYNSVACGKYEIPLCIRFCGEEKERADALFISALSEYRKKSGMHRTRIFENIDEIVKLCRNHSTALLTPAGLAAARRRSDNIAAAVRNVVLNYTAPPSVGEAAEGIGMSARGFTKLFKRCTNLTYHDFATGVRAEEAVKLLRYSTKSIAEIAAECGYADNSHFTKTLIKLYNSSPHLLRREMIEVAREKDFERATAGELHNWESRLDPETIREHYNISIGKRY